MLELRQVSKRFASKPILDQLSLTLPPGETTCVLGPSGCGKTTLLRVAAGLLPVDAGERLPARLPRASFVFQEDRLLPWYDALKNLTALHIPQADAMRALAAVLLDGEAHTFPDAMSGGMQRRLAIARALAFGGDLFFLDEPLRGLDMATAVPVLAAIRGALTGKTALLITHSPAEALALGHHLLLVGGPPVHVISHAKTADFADEEALKTWLQTHAPSFEAPKS